jgi:hypothetical protein
VANRYWIGTGNWDATNTANWSVSSGGAGGASVPSSPDAVFFDAGSGGGTCTVTAVANCAGLNCTGFTGTLTGSSQINCNGDFTLVVGMNYTRTGVTSIGGTGTRNVTTAGKTLYSIISSATATNFNGNVYSLGSFQQSAGTVTLNNNLTCQSLTLSGPGVKVFNANNAIITLTAPSTVWNYSGSNLTFNRGTSKIVLSSISTAARTFVGGGLTYYDLEIGGATGVSTLTITGSNTFNTISSTKTVAHTVRLTAGTTTTVTNWNINGSSGNQFTLNSTITGSQATLAKAGGGTVSVNFTTITDIIGTPTSTWSALTSNGCVDGGNNTGWTFTGSSGIAYALSCANGSYVLTGQSAVLKPKYNYVLSCTNGAYSIAGKDATLIYYAGAASYALNADAGTYAVTGQSATLAKIYNYSLSCANGNYAITGENAVLNFSGQQQAYGLACNTGNYGINGQASTLTYLNKSQVIWGGARPWEKIILEAKDFEEDDEETVIIMLIKELAELI